MRTLILSDIHLGNDQGLDIYAGGGILPAVIHRAAAPDTRILLNGDTVDFLMNEDPLVLDVERAVAAARAIAAAPESAAVFQALGRALAKGAEVIVRLGNHDVELALAEVQAVFRDALGVPPAVGARLVFQLGDAPMVLDVAGARVLVTHGEQNDNWNKVDYIGLRGQRENGSLPGFRYAPGTLLVKTIMNRLKREHGLRFADLLKPDFQGAVLTALAVAPDAVRELFQGSTLDIAWQLFRQSRRPLTFNPSDEDEPDLGFASRVEAAGLSDSERRGLQALIGRGALSFGVDDAIEGALARLGRAGLSLYAAAHRLVAGSAGERYFSLTPDPDERAEARRLARKYEVDAVVFGHTHAARFAVEEGLTSVNTGTWIQLMALPAPEASAAEWAEFLMLLRKNPGLDPERGPHAPLLTRLTGATLEPLPVGGARVRLLQYRDGAPEEVLAESIIAPRRRP